MKTLFVAIKTIIFGTIFVAIWVFVDLLIRNLDNYYGGYLPHWVYIPGIILLIIGLPITVITAFSFVIFGKGTPAPFDAPKEFVVAGPYKYVRNPMYVGGFFAFIGFAFVNFSVSMLIFPFIWYIVVHLLVVFYEEKELEKKFGQSFLDYKKKVNRWIPKLK